MLWVEMVGIMTMDNISFAPAHTHLPIVLLVNKVTHTLLDIHVYVISWRQECSHVTIGSMGNFVPQKSACLNYLFIFIIVFDSLFQRAVVKNQRLKLFIARPLTHTTAFVSFPHHDNHAITSRTYIGRTSRRNSPRSSRLNCHRSNVEDRFATYTLQTTSIGYQKQTENFKTFPTHWETVRMHMERRPDMTSVNSWSFSNSKADIKMNRVPLEELSSFEPPFPKTAAPQQISASRSRAATVSLDRA